MKLTDLYPQWVTYEGTNRHRTYSDIHSHVTYSADVDGYVEPPDSAMDMRDVDGVAFLCPACFVKNGGAIGTETVLCWFANNRVPPEERPGPGRWIATGASFADLTLTPSVNVNHEHWHGWITNGEVK